MKLNVKNLTTHPIHLNLKRDKTNKLTKVHDRITLLPGTQINNSFEVSEAEYKQIEKWLGRYEKSGMITVKENMKTVKEEEKAPVKQEEKPKQKKETAEPEENELAEEEDPAQEEKETPALGEDAPKRRGRPRSN